jgi:hypothetical protein
MKSVAVNPSMAPLWTSEVETTYVISDNVMILNLLKVRYFRWDYLYWKLYDGSSANYMVLLLDFVTITSVAMDVELDDGKFLMCPYPYVLQEWKKDGYTEATVDDFASKV